MSATMTKGEREDLQRLIKQREKVQKSAAKQRSAELLADFENQMGSVYQPEDDPVWKAAAADAHKVVQKAQAAIKARCAELGIVKEFAPGLTELVSSWRVEQSRQAPRRTSRGGEVSN
jgi:vacuolar-type H+-ATPase subunit H